MTRSRRAAIRRAAWVLARTVATVWLSVATADAVATPQPTHPTKRSGPPKAPPVTDANVADRVLAARSKADQQALAAYYKAKAGAEDPRIAHYEQLFRAYMQLEGKPFEPLQRQARALLKAARMSKKYYELLAQAHLTMAEKIDDSQ
jgi:hypothetical protein